MSEFENMLMYILMRGDNICGAVIMKNHYVRVQVDHLAGFIYAAAKP